MEMLSICLNIMRKSILSPYRSAAKLDELSHGAILGERAGFDEINLNVGCPSDRVKSGEFGACLMAETKVSRGLH